MRRAHENIDKTLKSAQVFLGQFDLSRQVSFLLLNYIYNKNVSFVEDLKFQGSYVYFVTLIAEMI